MEQQITKSDREPLTFGSGVSCVGTERYHRPMTKSAAPTIHDKNMAALEKVEAQAREAAEGHSAINHAFNARAIRLVDMLDIDATAIAIEGFEVTRSGVLNYRLAGDPQILSIELTAEQHEAWKASAE